MIKKISMLFVVFSLFSCSSENEGNEISNITEQETKIKQDLILEKIKELGLDPNQVKFTDEHFNEDKIIVKSIDNLGDFLKVDEEFSNINSLWNDDFNTLDNNTLEENQFNKTNSSYDFGTIEYCTVYKHAPVSGAIYMNLQYQFAYSILNLKYRERDAITNVESFITGFVLGVSYQQTYADTEIHLKGPMLSELHELRIHGLLNYNLFIEGIGTVYTRPVLTVIKFRLPFSKYSCEPGLIQALVMLPSTN